jgi:predicted RND superfamily exporter protein
MINTTYSIWIPFLSALIGGLLVLAGQFMDRKSKRKTETKTTLREIYAFNRKLEALMKSNFRELAMAKVHVEYWWYCNQTTPLGKENQKYYEEHLKSQVFAREIERQIGEIKADFIGHVRKFQAIKELKQEIENQLEEISDLTNAKAKTYNTSLQFTKVRHELVDEDEKELREIYYKNLVNFKSINDYLQTLLT